MLKRNEGTVPSFRGVRPFVPGGTSLRSAGSVSSFRYIQQKFMFYDLSGTCSSEKRFPSMIIPVSLPPFPHPVSMQITPFSGKGFQIPGSNTSVVSPSPANQTGAAIAICPVTVRGPAYLFSSTVP